MFRHCGWPVTAGRVRQHFLNKLYKKINCFYTISVKVQIFIYSHKMRGQKLLTNISAFAGRCLRVRRQLEIIHRLLVILPALLGTVVGPNTLLRCVINSRSTYRLLSVIIYDPAYLHRAKTEPQITPTSN